MSQWRILKNLVVVCLGFLFLFTAYQALANLQSTMNMEDDIGVVSQSVIYAVLIVSSIFLPKLVIQRFGCKVTLVMSILTYAPYVAANFYPHMWTFVPAAVLVGIGAAPLWSAKCTYINEISFMYSSHGKESSDVVTSRFFGIFFMIFQNTQIWGNLISFFVLRPTPKDETLIWGNETFINNDTLLCGADFCSGINENLMPPSVEKRHMLVAIYISCVILAAIIVALFLDPLNTEKSKSKEGEDSVFARSIATLRQLKKADQMLLVPLTIFSGMEQAFILSEYTKAYVACAWGLYYVGLVFICFGVVNAIMSYLSGRLIKYVPRMVLMMTAAAGNLAVCLVLLFWYPTSEHAVYFFIIVGVWGLSDAIWQTQVNAYYGVLFRSSEEAAFANYRLWESVGFFVAFGYSGLLCVTPKIYLLIAALFVGMLGYVTVETKTSTRKMVYDVSK
ncbi:UNC93-like protein [Uloborus diversus]|uniref:UNC93-like protein n=1 Tax=Uloborus diversus TaxID=327109 RepID=UPI002409AF92|nr:UNC93-like protein [Uloborus diversus]